MANPILWASLLALPLGLSAQVSAPDLTLEYHGAGWVQLGKVESSTIVGDLDYNKNWMQSAGSQVSATATLDEHWEAGLGVGVVQVHLARGSIGVAPNWYPFWVAYVSEARVTYSDSLLGGKLQITGGSFPYGYTSDNKNLGAYLTRGYVYPGTLESGFGGVFGAMARYQRKGFRNDLVLKSEDAKPVYDGSLIDAVSYEVMPGLELGAGVNFYRLFKQDADLTSPGATCGGLSYGTCAIIDTNGAGPADDDTLTGSLSGTKLMARFRLDPKALFGFSTIGSQKFGGSDLVLYGETAILGLKDYPIYYDDMLHRMPVMMGFNFPMLGYLDYLSLEVEYYASKNSSDTRGASFGAGWVPWNEQDPDLARYAARDDWKWSINAAKTVFGHAQLSAQFANDHLRLGGPHDVPWIGKEAMRTPQDWYWTCKLAYFF